MDVDGFGEPTMTWNARFQGERDLNELSFNDYDLPGINLLFWTKFGHKLSYFDLSHILPKASFEFEHFLKAFPTQAKKNMADVFKEESHFDGDGTAQYSATMYCDTIMGSSTQLDVLLNERALKVISFRLPPS